jgi:hypothetical protein
MLLNIHLQTQVITQVTNIPKSMVFHHSYMFQHISAFLREFQHQFSHLLKYNDIHNIDYMMHSAAELKVKHGWCI